MKTLNSSTRDDEETSTLGDSEDPLIFRHHSESSESHSEKSYASGSDTVESSQRRSPSIPIRGRNESPDFQSQSRLRARNQSTTNRSNGSISSGSSAANSMSTHAFPTETDGDTDQSTSELESRLQHVRSRAREASIHSLILVNRVQFLTQRIKLEQIRSCGV